MMPYQIGTDEAGYGPNYGPLVVAGTAWEVPDRSECLYRRLRSRFIASKPAARDDRLMVADSKKVYGSNKQMGALELPVLAIFYAVHHEFPSTWRQFADRVLTKDSQDQLAGQSWLRGHPLLLPVAADSEHIVRAGEKLIRTLADCQVRLRHIVCETVFAGDFNRGVTQHGNKASFLSATTLNLVRELLQTNHEDVLVGCDKHGGRTRYGALIQEIVTSEFVLTDFEERELSQYRFNESGREVQLRFAARGESFFPTAFASMMAKYVRQLMMIQWNEFWQQHQPGLKPTQGYPQDAKRFREDIRPTQRKLAIDDHSIWRIR